MGAEDAIPRIVVPVATRASQALTGRGRQRLKTLIDLTGMSSSSSTNSWNRSAGL